MSGWQLEKEIEVDEYYTPEDVVYAPNEFIEIEWDRFILGVDTGFLTDADGHAEDKNFPGVKIFPSQAPTLTTHPDSVRWFGVS